MTEPEKKSKRESCNHLSLPKKTKIKDADKYEVYKDRGVVDSYDRRLYFGLSGGLFYQKETSCIVDWFPPNGKILDIPCGTGKLGRLLKDRGDAEIYGIDISPLMLEVAQKTEAYHKLETGDFANLSYLDNYFDVIYVSRFFMLFNDINPFLNEVKRVLKPSGLFIFDNIRRSIHNLVNRTFGTAEGWNYPRSTSLISKIMQEHDLKILERRSAFLFSTGLMNRLPPFMFKSFSALESILPERCRVMEFYKATKPKQDSN